jgi:hypothetical protein
MLRQPILNSEEIQAAYESRGLRRSRVKLRQVPLSTRAAASHSGAGWCVGQMEASCASQGQQTYTDVKPSGSNEQSPTILHFSPRILCISRTVKLRVHHEAPAPFRPEAK